MRRCTHGPAVPSVVTRAGRVGTENILGFLVSLGTATETEEFAKTAVGPRPRRGVTYPLVGKTRQEALNSK